MQITPRNEPISRTIEDPLLSWMQRYRRNLHRIPELGFDLPRTHAYVRSTLESLGYTVEVVARSGIVAVRQGIQAGAVAFRADMDALSIQESARVGMSRHNGAMHACGHDGHMAALLGLARVMASRERPQKSVVFIFQPAEETAGGAEAIIHAGVLERYHIEAIYGMHLYPGLAEETIGVREGILMGQDGEFDVQLTGRSSHGAQPHLGVDALAAGAELLTRYRTLPETILPHAREGVLNVGTIHGGEARNVVGGSARLSGMLRSFDEENFDALVEGMHAIDRDVEARHGVHIDSTIRRLFPPVVNDSELYRTLIDTVDMSAIVHPEPLLLAEDFAYYQQRIPGLFFLLGTKNDEEGLHAPLHSPAFDFNERVLLRAVEVFLRLARAHGV